MKPHLLAGMLIMTGAAQAADPPAWIGRLALWATPELEALRGEVVSLDAALAALPALFSINSGNRTGFQSAGNTEGEDLWVEVDLNQTNPVDQVVLIPLLARGAGGRCRDSGFPGDFYWKESMPRAAPSF